ncbi:MAG: HEAT repeat domain-containing protein [Planctomycetota bacterium]|jgi:hypothetical protein
MRSLPLLAFALSVVLAALPAGADVLTTSEGLVLEGRIVRDAEGNFVIETTDGTVVLPPERVAAVREGKGPREALAEQAAGLAEGDAEAWFRLGLEAEAAGLPDLARRAFETVVSLDPDHAAARRALGHQRVDDAWVSEAVASRRRGLVLFEGRWLLPAQVEQAAAEEAPVVRPPSDDARTRAVIRTLATADEPLRRAAQLALVSVPAEQRLRAGIGTLFDEDPAVRKTAARLLGGLGDEAGLRPLILSAARDVDPSVRRESLAAAASFGHDDTAIPFIRALGSENLQLVANAAQALGQLDDDRAIAYIVKRLTSHGSSTRNMVAFLNQVSYVRDYDVEIAQASNIANPDVATIQEGVILDIRVLDAAIEKTWVEAVLVDSLSRLTGQEFRSREDAVAWYRANEASLPEFPGAGEGRAPRRRSGRVIGAPMR